MYNGAGGAVYDTEVLSGTLDDEGCGVGALAFDVLGMQNGSPDGVALVSNGTTVIQFLSYEGTMTAVGGAADGLLSVNVGDQTLSTASLQLSGSGDAYADFTWGTNTTSKGSLNAGQTISPCTLATNCLRCSR